MKRFLVLILLLVLWACSQGTSEGPVKQKLTTIDVVETKDRAEYVGHLMTRHIAQADGAGTRKRKMVYLSVSNNNTGAGVYVGLLSDELYDQMPDGDILVVVDTGSRDHLAFEVVSWRVVE